MSEQSFRRLGVSAPVVDALAERAKRLIHVSFNSFWSVEIPLPTKETRPHGRARLPSVRTA